MQYEPIDPLANTLRRAIVSICAGMMSDDEHDASPSFLMAWPFLEGLDFGVWQRFGKVRELVDHPALDDLLALSEAVTRYDVDAVNVAAVNAARWADGVIEEAGTNGVDAETRRQGYDAQVPVALDLGVPASLTHRQACRFTHRIGARLLGAVHDLVEAQGDDDLAHDLAEHLRQGCSMFGWWVEGTHIVLLATEGRLADDAASDLVAEVRALLMPLHFGLSAEDPYLSPHVESAAARALQVASALARWKEAPDAPLDFSIDDAVLDQWHADVATLLGSEAIAAEAGPVMDARTDAFVERLVALDQKGATDLALLEALQDGVADLALLDEAPETYGARLHARRTMARACAAVGNRIGASPEMLFIAAVAGQAVDTFGTPPA